MNWSVNNTNYLVVFTKIASDYIKKKIEQSVTLTLKA